MVQSLARASSGTALYWSCARSIHESAEDTLRDVVGQLLEKGDGSIVLASDLIKLRLSYKDANDLTTLFICLLGA